MRFTPAPTRPQRPALSLLTHLITAIIIAAQAAAFQPGEKVKLTRDESLTFRERKLRDAKAGEEFRVLADRADLKKVFVSTTDASGREIAVSAPADAFLLVPFDPSKARAEAVAAANAGRFPDAERIVAKAISSSPKDLELLQLRDTISAVRAASQQLTGAKENAIRASQTAAQKRKNAATADRPNPLNPTDTSNHDRAAKMREEADQIEENARQAVQVAEEKYRNTIASLCDPPVEKSDQRRQAPPNIGMITPRPGVELTPAEQAHNRTAQMQRDAAEKAERIQLDETLAQWTNDEAVAPSVAQFSSASPSYSETLEFINGMIAGNGQKMWFGKKTGKMILESPNDLIIFDPGELTPEVKYSATANEEGRHRVELYCTNGRLSMKWVSKWTGESKKVNGLKLLTGDNLDRDKLVKASVHLVEIFGGKVDSF